MTRAITEFHPLTPERWNDLQLLFGERGACGGCWCMWWRIPRHQWKSQKGELNRKAFQALVNAGPAPGLLAYRGGQPVGWCAVAPRQTYVMIEKSRSLKRLDDKPVWSVTCFFVRKDQRRTGLSVELLRAAARFVKRQGGKILEGYPIEPKNGEMPAAFAWTGTASAFRAAGFEEAGRPGARPIVRLHVR